MEFGEIQVVAGNEPCDANNVGVGGLCCWLQMIDTGTVNGFQNVVSVCGAVKICGIG